MAGSPGVHDGVQRTSGGTGGGRGGRSELGSPQEGRLDCPRDQTGSEPETSGCGLVVFQACIVHEKGGRLRRGQCLGDKASFGPWPPKAPLSGPQWSCPAGPSRSSLQSGHRGKGPLPSVPPPCPSWRPEPRPPAVPLLTDPFTGPGTFSAGRDPRSPPAPPQEVSVLPTPTPTTAH